MLINSAGITKRFCDSRSRKHLRIIKKTIFIMYFLLILLASRLSLVMGGGYKLSKGQSVSGNGTIISQNGTFELGFFTPSIKNSLVYLGIWYKNSTDRAIVWVGNRETPVMKASASTKYEISSQDGNLVINHESSTVWTTNSTASLPDSVEAVLLDSGNLVLRDSLIPSTIFWQSFDHPTDTWLPGARLGYNTLTLEPHRLISWKNAEDPSPGLFSVVVPPTEPSKYFLEWNMSTRYWNSGSWTATQFTDVPELSYTSDFKLLHDDVGEVFYTYSLYNHLLLSRLVITSSGEFQQLTSTQRNLKWSTTFVQPREQSEVYGFCGAFSILDISLLRSTCACLKGFTLFSADETTRLDDWSAGCVRNKPLLCETAAVSSKNDKFKKIPNVKLPSDEQHYLARTFKECQVSCLRDCSCTAYAYHEQECLVWNGHLLNVQSKDNDFKNDLYLKLSGSEHLEEPGKKRVWVIITSVLAPLVILTSACCIGYRWTKSANKKGGTSDDLLAYDFGYSYTTATEETKAARDLRTGFARNSDLPLFSYKSVSAATNNFSADNKLGEGGFGPVYKGKISKGQEIALKRLSKRSGQGIVEFRNEIQLIAKLQHRNLVRLLGYCIEEDENILIYEYMPNRSLDFFLFDRPNKVVILQWATRMNIIKGIAQGILYLHEYSRLRIIHRDLKASNILLDNEMNPKVSDFGLARIFGGSDTEANTRRIVGTYGYMAPEYALEGRFSIKSDVFSFGVLVLEIMSGRKNTGFYHSDSLNLLCHTWELWTSGRTKDLMDPQLNCGWKSEMLRYINIGLLCVQEYSDDRPNISSVISMIDNDLTTLPKPKPPAYSTRRGATGNASYDNGVKHYFSLGGLTMSAVEPR